MQELDSTAAGTDYTMRELGTVKLGPSTYRVEVQEFAATGGTMVWLIGARGGAYMLRAYSNRSGLFQVINFRTGQPLRVRGNAVEVTMLGTIVEQAAR